MHHHCYLFCWPQNLLLSSRVNCLITKTREVSKNLRQDKCFEVFCRSMSQLTFSLWSRISRHVFLFIYSANCLMAFSFKIKRLRYLDESYFLHVPNVQCVINILFINSPFSFSLSFSLPFEIFDTVDRSTF